MQSSYGKSIDYLAESSLLLLKKKQIETNNRQSKKNFFTKGLKQAADSLKGNTYVQELFEKGDEPIPSVNPNPGYGARTIDFSDVI